MPIDLYYFPPSPPCRSIMLLAKALDVKLQLKVINILNAEQKSPEYAKMNPQQTIPTLDDDGFVIWESRAILGYLVNQYAKDDTLYPKDPKERAMVDQRLYFDASYVGQRATDYFKKVVFLGQLVNEDDLERMHQSLQLLNTFLDGQLWVAGPNMSIADFAIVVSVSNMEAMGVDLNAYPNIANWYTRARSAMPGYEEINQAGAMMMGEMFKNRLKELTQ